MAHNRRRWPLLVISAPAFVAVWSGWVGLGAKTGFGVVRPLPGIIDEFSIDTAITLPVGGEAFAIYALYFATDPGTNSAARRFAWRASIAGLALGFLGQVAYHLTEAANIPTAPWWITTLVAGLPVLIVGAAAYLFHLAGQVTHAADPAVIDPAVIDPGSREASDLTPVRPDPGQVSAATEAKQVTTVQVNESYRSTGRVTVQDLEAAAKAGHVRPTNRAEVKAYFKIGQGKASELIKEYRERQKLQNVSEVGQR